MMVPSDFEEFVPVPVDGDFLVREGKITPLTLVDPDYDCAHVEWDETD